MEKALIRMKGRLLLRLHQRPEGVTAAIQAQAGIVQLPNNLSTKPIIKLRALIIKIRMNPGGVRLLNNWWSDLNTEEVNLPSGKNLLLFPTGTQLRTNGKAAGLDMWPTSQKNSKRKI